MNPITVSQLKAMSVEQRFSTFVSWLSGQPRDQLYSFHSIHDCALCKFAKANNLSEDGWISANDHHISYRQTFEHVIVILPTHAITHLIHSRSLGELYDRLLPLVTPQPLSDEAMDALERRELVGLSVRTLDYEGGA